MSADNWAVCPKCNKQQAEARQKREDEIKAMYGAVPAEKWLEAKKQFEATEEREEYTLREDYEIGITPDGEFYAIYSGGCRECSFSFEFKHEEKVT